MDINRELRNLYKTKEEIKKLKAIENNILSKFKLVLNKNESDILENTKYKLISSIHKSNRLDTKGLKEVLPDVYNKFTKETTQQRITIGLK